VRRLPTAVAVTLAAALALAGCSGDPAPTSPSDSAASSTTLKPAKRPQPPRATAPPRPEVGACYLLSYDDALAPTAAAAPVRCRRPHTAVTYYVGTLDTVVDGHLVAVDAERVRDQPSTVCPRRLPGYLGAGEPRLRLSVLRAVWFSPSLAESDEGQSWFRCDVIAPQGDTLTKLRTAPRGALAGAAGRTAYGVCGTAEPGTAGFQRVACSHRHRWRAVSAYDLPGKKYPGLTRVRQIGSDQCEQIGKQQAADPLNYQWGFDYPTREQWVAGTHFGLCWVPD
jgi:hypothetical protein